MPLVALFQPIEQVGEEEVQGDLRGKDGDDNEVGDSCGGFYQPLSQQSGLLPSLAAVFSFPSLGFQVNRNKLHKPFIKRV
jgi:hypothetical protein